jgi:hydroxymethylbilane synthase
VPSANQGTIIVVAKRGSAAESCSRNLDHAGSRVETMIERRILETVGGGCVVPMAVHAAVSGDRARVLAEVLSLDGRRFVRLDENVVLGPAALSAAEDIGQRLMKMGGRELVDEAVRQFGSQ